MFHSGSVCIPAVITLVLCRSGACSKYSGTDVYTQCTQTARSSLYSTPRVTIPKQISALGVLEPMSEYSRLKMDLCPNSRFLKLSWTINQTQDCDVMICLKMENSRKEEIMDTVCYRMHIQQSHYASAMDCWFPVDFISKRPIIRSWILPIKTSVHGIFYGSLDTSALDPVNSCKDICETTPMNIGSQIYCQDTDSSITYDKSTTIEHLSFNAIDNSSCKNGIKIFKQFDGRLEYQLNCSFSGVGYIKILYSIQGKYCLKYQMVTISCPYGKSSETTLADGIDDTHSFGTFMIFGLVCVIVIAATFFTVVIVVLWLYDRKYYSKSPHRRHSAGARHVSLKADKNYPLKTFSPQPSGSRPVTCVVNTDVKETKKTSPRQRSASTSSDKMPEAENEKQRLIVLPMRRSITMALLEETDLFYKKRILFLPIPFDHFTNDVTKILKSVFMETAGVPSQCCFDRKIFQEYMTGDRFKWIENVLGDHDKILIFLCFTSVSVERTGTKRDSMADEILDNILITKVKSHRLCKVIFLYLTDSADSVQKVGDIATDSFHISSTDCYVNFVGNVMNFCGRNPEENPDLIRRISSCEASRHFLRFIGINDIS
ncbi:uncharacterized protein LOC123538576 isoform X2 [Mercenaria mercenaria]|uniref:uncharacterized protein LOC123538576 isoform X2 n=1 Tax=Mercenaria mercenaria TaxID=6596 RepID=UPI00234E42FD|nr:uncharacterized protein LOC123538576 isoform X2 [Mercenaria mercenaria]